MTTIQTLFGTFDEKQLKELKGAITEINEYQNSIKVKQNQIKEIVSRCSEAAKAREQRGGRKKSGKNWQHLQSNN